MHRSNPMSRSWPTVAILPKRMDRPCGSAQPFQNLAPWDVDFSRMMEGGVWQVERKDESTDMANRTEVRAMRTLVISSGVLAPVLVSAVAPPPTPPWTAGKCAVQVRGAWRGFPSWREIPRPGPRHRSQAECPVEKAAGIAPSDQPNAAASWSKT